MSKQNLAITLIRVVLGITMLVHGISKFQMGLDQVAGWFDSIGVPSFLAYVVALGEVLGGIALIVGLLTRLASAGIAIIMIGAILSAKLAGGYLGNGQGAGWELDLLLLAIALYHVISGQVGVGIDSLFGKDKNTAPATR